MKTLAYAFQNIHVDHKTDGWIFHRLTLPRGYAIYKHISTGMTARPIVQGNGVFKGYSIIDADGKVVGCVKSRNELP
jgi:hypothetical protein